MKRRFTCASLLVLSIVLFSCRKESLAPVSPVVNTPVPPMIKYEESKILRAPGNYQLWNVPEAPKLVSPGGNGEYEGYINFTLNNTEFWLVRGTAWSNVITYNETGNHTFGHNGGFFTLPDGAGIYKVNASTNSFTWSCKKITKWEISGSAANGADIEMTESASGVAWSVTGNFAAGSFLFKANGGNEIVFGQGAESPAGVPVYGGEKIQISKPGNYTISLSLGSAGNYIYSIKKNS